MERNRRSRSSETRSQECPALQNLVGVRSLIGKRAAATRQANAAQIAAGLAPFKGKAGKRRRRAAENAALAAQERRPSTANEGPGAR